MPEVQNITIAEDDGSPRLDRWLRRRFPGVAQGRIERMCRKGEIRVDGRRAQASLRLAPGQTVRVPPIADAPSRAASSASRTAQGSRVSEADAQMIRAAVLYRDDDVIALNKPPGIATQGGAGQNDRHLDAFADALRFGRSDRPRLVHRLDRDTSGALLLARTPRAAAGLAKALKARDARKVYWAAVAGAPRPTEGSIRSGLVKRATGGQKEKMILVAPDEVSATPGARLAETEYTVIEAAAKRAAWVALSPITGRTHQLRVHMASIGCPIVGDGKYGGRAQENAGDGWGANLGGGVSRKLHLHARSIAIAHPVTGKTLRVTAPLPDHMARTWALFGWDTETAPADPFAES